MYFYYSETSTFIPFEKKGINYGNLFKANVLLHWSGSLGKEMKFYSEDLRIVPGSHKIFNSFIL